MKKKQIRTELMDLELLKLGERGKTALRIESRSGEGAVGGNVRRDKSDNLSHAFEKGPMSFFH